MLKASVLALVLASMVFGGLAVYFYAAPPAADAQNVPGATSSALVTNQPSGQVITVQFNGTSYSVPAKRPNAPSFGCPAGTDPSVCTLLRETCGNGVGSSQEPWKTCFNCPFDAGCSGDNSCDPYTHQCSSPASACMVIAGGYRQAG